MPLEPIPGLHGYRYDMLSRALRMPRCALVIGGAGLCLLLGACGPNPSDAVSTPLPTTAATTSTERLTSVPTPAANAVTLVLDPAASKASYHAHEQLVGRTLPSEAVGTTSAVNGSLAIATDGSVVADQSQISVDLSKLTSDESRRDNFIKGNTLQTGRYPTATFVPRQVEGLPMPLPATGEATFQLLGDLTVHGVTRPVIWQVIAQFAGASVSGTATTSVNISDFGMTPPKAGPVLSIEDGLGLELAFSAARQA
ncbi:MAG TPA: YceI family protein [Chloroflexota bacterium]